VRHFPVVPQDGVNHQPGLSFAEQQIPEGLPHGVQAGQPDKDSGRVYQLAEQTRYWGFVDAWPALVADGTLGQITFCEGQYFHYSPTQHFRDPSTLRFLSPHEVAAHPPAAPRAPKAAVLNRDGVPVEPLAPDPLGWRTRVRYAVTDDGRLGWHRYRSSEVIPVDRPAADRASAYGLEPLVVDGNDVAAVREMALAAGHGLAGRASAARGGVQRLALTVQARESGSIAGEGPARPFASTPRRLQIHVDPHDQALPSR